MLILLLILLLAILIAAGIMLGSVRFSASEVLEGLFSEGQSPKSLIIRGIRLPRVMGSILCGAMLGLCGMAFQAVFRNPMADPYLLGVSSGASFAVSLGTLAGITAGFLPGIPQLAFLGGLGVSALALVISRNSQRTLILTGIALSSLFSALTTLVIFLNRHELSNVIFWSMGSFATMNMSKASIMLVMFAASFIFMLIRSRSLDLLLLDEQSARSLGLDVNKERRLFLVIGTVCTAGAVCFCGTIGFAGLLAPHISRMAAGPQHKRLAPVTALTGAIIMLAADIIARFIIAPSELPVGVITAMLGTPLFISLACRRNNMLW